MADKTKIIGKAATVVSPGAKLAKTLAELRNKKKKADFQKGDYSDIDSDETITRKVESVKMPEFKRKDDNSVKMPEFKRKKTITVPKYPKKFKSGGRAGYKHGGAAGCAIKGISPILKK